MENKLIFALVGRNSGEDLVKAAKGAGAWGGTIIPCRSISDNALLQFFGIGESDQDVVLIVTGEQVLNPILDAMKQSALADKKLAGFVALTGVGTNMKFKA